ncbi:MAG: KH domain-containing protein [Candidatus Pacebacteria bacterium]|nr:KH domain-containing protein [Candidatus Paceibacterota bacterium]
MAEIKDQDFLEYIVKTLVDHPDDVIVNRGVDEMGVLLTVKVNPEDMGQLIGRQGSTARAIRSLVKIIGLKNHARVNLKIEEPEGGSRVREERKEEEKKDDISDVTDGLDDLKI